MDEETPERKWLGIVYDRSKDLSQSAIEHRAPEKVALILRMTAEGYPAKEIREAADVSHAVLRRVQKTHHDATEGLRKRAAVEYWSAGMEFAELVQKRAEQLAESDEDLRRVNPKDLALAAKTLMGVAMPLAGMASDIKEVRSEVSLEDAKKLIEEAKKRVHGEAIEAEIIQNGGEQEHIPN